MITWHPTQKPIALLERIIGLTTREDAIVLDPFCGCGTTIQAAERMGRRWMGIDVSYAAILVIQERLSSRLPSAQYTVDGIPSGETEARALARLDPYIFQQWAVGRVNGQAPGERCRSRHRWRNHLQVGREKLWQCDNFGEGWSECRPKHAPRSGTCCGTRKCSVGHFHLLE